MKKSLLLIPALVLGLLTINYSCSEDDDPTIECQDTANPCNSEETFKTCASSDSEGYYEYNGQRYDFTSSNLTEVATELSEDMCANLGSTIDVGTVDLIIDRTYQVMY